MKILKRLSLVLLIFLLLFSMLFSCQKGGVPTATEEGETDAPETPSKEAFPIVLSDESGVYYTVVRPAAGSTVIKDLSDDLVQFASQNGGANNLNLRWKTDQTEAEGSELLVGYTNRPESREVLESIGYDDFAIVSKNGKIVVAAHTENRLREAVSYLKEHLLKVEKDENGKNALRYLGDYTFVSERKDFLFDAENRLSDYSIVYPASSAVLKTEAEAMRDQIRKAFGTELSVKADSEAEGKQEIILGRTNRGLSQKHFASSTGAYSFASLLLVEDKQILIGGATDAVTVSAARDFTKQYLGGGCSYTFNLDAKTYLLNTGYSFAESPDLAEGAEMRIMSFNVLCELWDSKAVDVESRMRIVTATLLTYSPEVVGLQEISDQCYQSLNPLFEGTYAFVDTKTERGKTNFSPLAYNVEKVTLLEHGVKTLSSGNNPSLRVISWGYFERKSDGERFFVANTHWDLTAMPESRTKQAIEMGDFMVAMKEKYDCPVISTGDYNTQSHQEQFQTYLDHSKLADAGLTANVINRNFKSTHTLFEDPVPTPDVLAIDHIFYSSDIEALYYNMLIDKTVIDASDHFPVYADIRFKK